MANTSYKSAFGVWRADILEVLNDEVSYEVVVLRSMDGTYSVISFRIFERRG